MCKCRSLICILMFHTSNMTRFAAGAYKFNHKSYIRIMAVRRSRTTMHAIKPNAWTESKMTCMCRYTFLKVTSL